MDDRAEAQARFNFVSRNLVGDLAAGGHQVIAYDRRGYGRSNHRPVCNYRVHAADLTTLVQHLGAPAHLVGWSSGGSVALALAAQHPQPCRSVVVIEATGHGLRYATQRLCQAGCSDASSTSFEYIRAAQRLTRRQDRP